MTEDDDTGGSVGPILGALAIIVAVLIAMWLFSVFSGPGPGLSDEQQVARAAVGQNDALQRRDYAAYRGYTCVARHGTEAEFVERQDKSEAERGNRVLEDMGAVSIAGDRATSEVTYSFEGDPEAEEKVPMSFVREDGAWKVCSTGPS
ncbi:lumazine-binding protein [Mycobacterium sp. pV006]|uniref:Rv0361 family membrane protein n=1 Tax=Mycobacterium sp. pV006 TaxID=3238983 RepID=UPI00351B39C0